MTTILDDRTRNIIPRWRDYRTTLSLGELGPVGTPVGEDEEGNKESKDYLENKLIDWRAHRSASFAADLVSSALVLGRHEEASDAAKFLLSKNSGATTIVRELAHQVLSEDREYLLRAEEPRRQSLALLKQRAAERIGQLRAGLREEPANGIAWADLALEYTVLGIKEKAERAIRAAVQFGSYNRFILRAAARFYIHQDDPSQAQYILRRASLVRSDPWLLAAEIAVSSAAHKPSNNVKAATKLLEDSNYSHFQTTELASAIATLELRNASIKNAKKLFRRAMLSPTENSVAQAEWASRRILTDFEVTPAQTPPRIYEARAWELYMAEKWEASFQQAIKWLYDEPFSVRPVLLSSYIKSTIEEDYEASAKLLRFGLIANPGDGVLLNNLAFVLASANKTQEAREYFNQIVRSELALHEKIIVTATEGLLRFREGFPDEGRAMYLQAIETARGPEFQHLRARAAGYLAREELLVQSSDAHKAYERACQESDEMSVQDITLSLLLKRLILLLERIRR